jgi:ADP-heptose:LPS heptosyltransferase
VGENSQAEHAATLTKQLANERIINLVGRTSIIELAALLRYASAAVGPDSGPGHLAAAVGTPYVTIFGPTLLERVAPYGCEDLAVVTSAACAPCGRRSCPGLNRVCMRSIRAEDVFAKMLQAIERGSKT